MTQAAVVLRPALPEDAPRAAELIHMIGTDMLNHIFRDEGSATRAILERLFAWPSNEFTYEDTTLAQIDGRIAGLVQAADRRRRAQNMRAMIPRYVQVMGLGASLRRLPRLVRMAELDRAIGRQALYVKHLGTAPEYRRRGVATALLNRCAERAVAAGQTALQLDVDRANEAGLRLYHRHGFRIIDQVHSERLERAFGFPGYYRMEKPL